MRIGKIGLFCMLIRRWRMMLGRLGRLLMFLVRISFKYYLTATMGRGGNASKEGSSV